MSNKKEKFIWLPPFFPQVVLPNGKSSTTCPAALGYSFAAGTTDGPGAFDFTQVGKVLLLAEVAK